MDNEKKQNFSKENLDQGYLFELFKEKSQEIRDFFAHYLKAITIYVAITGALLKFSLDENSTPELKAILSIFGISVSIVGVIACVFSCIYQKAASNDIIRLQEKLNFPEQNSNLVPFKYMTILVVIFLMSVIFGWFYLRW